MSLSAWISKKEILSVVEMKTIIEFQCTFHCENNLSQQIKSSGQPLIITTRNNII